MTTQLNFSVSEHPDAETDKPTFNTARFPETGPRKKSLTS